MFTHVLMPEGLAINLSFCHYGMLAVVKLWPPKINPATPNAIPNNPMIATGPLTSDHPV